ncbi:hypothetical protein BaRGS_00018320 [Batillaria attramentaria]|uniref:Uncharacterized protein n=1 Tax=Batillaria attramentaria TaxID=370345 RepID=A0ABD0K738_9CAEN
MPCVLCADFQNASQEWYQTQHRARMSTVVGPCFTSRNEQNDVKGVCQLLQLLEDPGLKLPTGWNLVPPLSWSEHSDEPATLSKPQPHANLEHRERTLCFIF